MPLFVPQNSHLVNGLSPTHKSGYYLLLQIKLGETEKRLYNRPANRPDCPTISHLKIRIFV